MSTPYIGSRISLISKSDVRYEGILCGIDTNESKVYLQHVRCFGTEDRRKENPIAPSTEVYEVIIFHSSDIKDLSVEVPPPVYDPMSFNSFSPMGSGYPQYGYPMMPPQYGPQYGYPYNPYHNYMYPQSGPMMGAQDGPNAPFHPPSLATPTSAPADQINDKSAPNQIPSLSLQPPQKIHVTTSKVTEKNDNFLSSQSQTSSDSRPVESQKDIDTKDANSSHSNENENQSNVPHKVDSSHSPDESQNSSQKPSSQKSHHHHHIQHHNKRSNHRNNNSNNFVYLPKGEARNAGNQADKSNDLLNSLPNNPNNNNSNHASLPLETPSLPLHSDQSANRNNHQNNHDYRQKRGGSNNRGYKGHYNNRRGFDSRSHHTSSHSSDPSNFHKSKEQTEQPQEDFDFLIANSKFEKLSISSLSGDLDKDLPKISPSYNKESFYDNISCDTLDREDIKDKKTYYEQRKIDSETFGDLGRRNGHRSRTRGRYDSHGQSNSSNQSNNQKRYNNNYRGHKNYRGNKNTTSSSETQN